MQYCFGDWGHTVGQADARVECAGEWTFITTVLSRDSRKQELLRLQGVILTPLWVQGNNRTLPSITCNGAFTPALRIGKKRKNLGALEDLVLNQGIGDGAEAGHLRVIHPGADNQTELPLTS